jgi:hypothetical protein
VSAASSCSSSSRSAAAASSAAALARSASAAPSLPPPSLAPPPPLGPARPGPSPLPPAPPAESCGLHRLVHCLHAPRARSLLHTLHRPTQHLPRLLHLALPLPLLAQLLLLLLRAADRRGLRLLRSASGLRGQRRGSLHCILLRAEPDDARRWCAGAASPLPAAPLRRAPLPAAPRRRRRLGGRPARASLALAFTHRLLVLWCKRHPPSAS